MPDMWLENIFPMYTPFLSITFTRSFTEQKFLIFISSNLSSFPFIDYLMASSLRILCLEILNVFFKKNFFCIFTYYIEGTWLCDSFFELLEAPQKFSGYRENQEMQIRKAWEA